MNNRVINQLNMVGTCINLATSIDYVNVWTGKEPADFATDFAQLQTDYAAVGQKVALVEAATGGATDAKSAAETVVENTAFVLTRALANHFKKTGDLTRLGKVDLAKRDLVRLTGQELVAKATEIRDFGTAAQSETGAAGRGVTAARVGAVTAAIAAYTPLMSSPRGQIVNRSTLLKEVETDAADLLDQLSDLDDLVLQFDGTDAGQRFMAAWKHARSIVDAGHGPGQDTPPTPTPPATPPAK
jgi:hypothetical protein